jgi:hypothetical protein
MATIWKGGLVVGGKLTRELSRAGLQTIMVVLSRAGRLHAVDDEKVEVVTKTVTKANQCCSNDCHVIAVAMVSGCRLIFTRDHNLHADAKNKAILNPPASIYQTKSHSHLLTECRCV